MRALVASVLVLSAVIPFAPPAVATTFEVSANDFAWTPADLAIDVGDTVEFILGTGTHNWVRDDEPDSCQLPCARTFAEAGLVEYHCGIHPSMTGVISVGALPVVAIGSPAAGATVSGVLHVEGTAAHATDDISSVTVRIGTGSAVTATLSGSGTSVTWSADVPTASVANGIQSLIARATTSALVAAETSIPIVVSNPVFIDMAIVSGSGQQNAFTTNTLSFIVRNQGNAASAVTVSAEYLYHGTWRPIGTTNTPGLAAGQSFGGSITWSPGVANPHVGAFTVRFTADPNGALPDPDRSNNVRAATAAWFTAAAPGVVVREPL